MNAIGLSVLVFISTNIDDIFLLLGFFADRRFRGARIAIGQFLGIGVLVAGSVLASLISLVVPTAYIGLLGVLPILIGAKRLIGNDGDHDMAPAHGARGDAFGQIASVAATTIANGGDNVGVYVPWFATRTVDQILIAILVFIAMTALWLMVGHWLVNHRSLGAPIRRYGTRAMPFVLIALGITILHDARSIELFD